MQESVPLAGMQVPWLKSLQASAQGTTFLLCVCDFCHMFIAHSESFTASGISAGLYFYSVGEKKETFPKCL